MNVDVKVPVFPESISEGTILNWYKKTGDMVEREENLIDLETDKAVMEITAPSSGTLKEIKVNNNATVHGGDVIAIIEAHENNEENTPKPEGNLHDIFKDKNNKQSTALKEDAQIKNQEKFKPENMIIKEKAATNVENNTQIAETQNEEDPFVEIYRQSIGLGIEKQVASKSNREENDAQVNNTFEKKTYSRIEKRVPMSRLRMRIAERLKESQNTAAILTTFNEINMKAVMDLRERYQDDFQKQHGVKLGFMSFFAKASIEALRKFPVINASIDKSEIIYHGYFDLGIAISSPRGLVVPILKNADQMSFAALEKNIRDLSEKARTGKLTIEELTGGTFTITNGGVFGSMLSTPILNPPQSAILGMHKIEERPVVENGEIVARPVMYVALSYDHRIIDGHESVLFLKNIKDTLEDPARMLLEI